jgi:hypothetical protein
MLCHMYMYVAAWGCTGSTSLYCVDAQIKLHTCIQVTEAILHIILSHEMLSTFAKEFFVILILSCQFEHSCLAADSESEPDRSIGECKPRPATT